MAKNMVVYGNTTIMDIRDTTAEAADVAAGKLFYNRSGERITGTYVPWAIPDEYQRVMYLRSRSKNTYIDTGLNLDGTLCVECEGRTGTNNSGILFDAYESSSLRMGGILYNRSNKRYDRYWTGVGYAQLDTTGIELGNTFRLVQNRFGVGIAQGSVVTSGAYKGTDATSSNAHVLLFSSQRTDYNPDLSDILWLRITNGDTVVRDYVPVVRVADGKPGMYDRANGEFYINAGTGPEFDYGDPV